MQKGNKMPHVLCFRFSALGDVAIASVVLKACARDNPDVQFTLAGPGLIAPLFEGVPNLKLFPVDKKQPLFGMLRQFIRMRPTHIADLHSVIRTFVLRAFLFFSGYTVVYLHKGRKARRRLLKDPVNEPPLIPVYRRYVLTLNKLGFSTPSLKESNTIPLEKGRSGSVCTPSGKTMVLGTHATHCGTPGRTGNYSIFIWRRQSREPDS